MKNNKLLKNHKNIKITQTPGFGLKKKMIVFALIPSLIAGGSMSILLFSKFNTYLSSEKIVFFLFYLALISVSTLATFILCFLIIRSITHPISMLSNAVKEVVEGNLDHEIKIKSKGEYSDLIDSLISYFPAYV